GSSRSFRGRLWRRPGCAPVDETFASIPGIRVNPATSAIARPDHVQQSARGEPVTFLEAIREAIWEEMERDERVFLMGEDIGAFGGAFKVTQGMFERFG